ncbi:hypothetical protein [Cryptosporangium sp. NPDC051539]|uniref:hypothetical protein n=1 Tax=Cryptosporangium sp. NPDC051539 TaxID=3363962 RepID=UPI0037A97B1A
MSGRIWAYIGLVLGGAFSVCLNVRHTYMPASGAPDGWGPEWLAVALAVFWPVAVVVGIEILARNTWRHGWRWTLARRGGLVPVIAVAAFVSYQHASALLAYYGEDRLTVAVGPLAIDGLMVTATAALLSTAQRAGEVIDAAAPLAEPGPDPAVMDAWWPELAAAWDAEAAILNAQEEATDQARRRAAAEAAAAAAHAGRDRAQASRAGLWEQLSDALHRSDQRPTDEQVRQWLSDEAELEGRVPSRALTRGFWRRAPGSARIDELRREVEQACGEQPAEGVPAATDPAPAIPGED